MASKVSVGDFVVSTSTSTADKAKQQGQVMATWDDFARVKWKRSDGKIEMWIEPVKKLKRK